jgi:hypothetical protein
MLDYARIINELDRSDLPKEAQNELRAILKPEALQDTLKRWLGQRDFAYQDTRFARFIALELAWAERTEEQQEDNLLPPTTFSTLFPKASQIEIKGQLTLGQFLRKEFVVLGGGAQIRIHPLPKSNDKHMPVVMDLNEIPTAIQVLKSLPQPEENTLENRINHQSDQELVQSYEITKPTTVDALKAWIGSRDVRACRAGYTGTPYSAVNALCAQIAWLCIDKTEKNAEESFWKILYPEITGVLDGMDNDQWPVYGEALLDETAPRLINYRGMVEHSDRITGEGKNDQRIQFFCEDHLNFWAIPRLERKAAGSTLTTLKFKNYYEFFCEMSRVLRRWSALTLGAAVEENIPPQGYMDIAPFQQVLIAHKHLRSTVFPKIQIAGANLGNVVARLIPEDKDQNNKLIKNVERHRNAAETCFAGNKEFLDKILKNETCQRSLEAISLEGVDIPSSFDGTKKMQGRDKLYYLPRHYAHLKLNELSDNDLIELIKNHDKQVVKLSVLADEFKHRLKATPFKGKMLYDRVFQLNDRTLQVAFLKALLGEDLDFAPVLDTFESSLYALKLCDKVILEDRYKSALKQAIETMVLPKLQTDWIEIVKQIQVVGDFEPENWHFIIQGLRKLSRYNQEFVLTRFGSIMKEIRQIEGRNDQAIFASCFSDMLIENFKDRGIDDVYATLNHFEENGFEGYIFLAVMTAILPKVDQAITTEDEAMEMLRYSFNRTSAVFFETLCRSINVWGKDFLDIEGNLRKKLYRGFSAYPRNETEISATVKAVLYPWLQARIRTLGDLGDFIAVLSEVELAEKEATLLQIGENLYFTTEELYSFYEVIKNKSSVPKLMQFFFIEKSVDKIVSYADYCILFHKIPQEMQDKIRPKVPKAYLKPETNHAFSLTIQIPTIVDMVKFALKHCHTQQEKQEVLRYFAQNIFENKFEDNSLFRELLGEADLPTQIYILKLFTPGQLFKVNQHTIYANVFIHMKDFRNNRIEIYEVVKDQINELLVATQGECFQRILHDFPEQRGLIYRRFMEDERVSTPSGIQSVLPYDLIAAFPEKLNDILEKFDVVYPLATYRFKLLENYPEVYKIVCKYLIENHFDEISEDLTSDDIPDLINTLPAGAWKVPKMLEVSERIFKFRTADVDVLFSQINPDKLLITFDLFQKYIYSLDRASLAESLNVLPLDKAIFENFMKRTTTPFNLAGKNNPTLQDYYNFFNLLKTDRMVLVCEILHRELEIMAKDYLTLASVLDIVNNEFFTESLAKLIIQPKSLQTYTFKALLYLLVGKHAIFDYITTELVNERFALTIESRDDFERIGQLERYGFEKEDIYRILSPNLSCVIRLYPLLSHGSIFHQNTSRFLAELNSVESEEIKLQQFFSHLPTDRLLQKAWKLVCMADPDARLEATVKACAPITHALYRPSVSTAAAAELREKVASVFKL